jgi:hypothetical protein
MSVYCFAEFMKVDIRSLFFTCSGSKKDGGNLFNSSVRAFFPQERSLHEQVTYPLEIIGISKINLKARSVLIDLLKKVSYRTVCGQIVGCRA